MIVDLRFKKLLIALSVYSIAMGFLESAVVVYLREIYYPHGFNFPMVSLSGRVGITEVLREAATMIMLVSVAWLSGENFRKRFAWFLYCFAVWDIFYYFFLKILLDWPSSVFTWDILFLIPVVWTGPVIAPIMVSLTMIGMALLILSGRAGKNHWLILPGAFFIFLSFIWDFSAFMLDHYNMKQLFSSGASQIALQQYIPYRFNWWFFATGEIMIIFAMALSYFKSKKISI